MCMDAGRMSLRQPELSGGADLRKGGLGWGGENKDEKSLILVGDGHHSAG